MSILCCSIFLLAPKWLIIEPKSPQSLKIIYQVLKFAAKHKAPLNRSALTYWEEDVPSRMDLGKSRYGGPFTTEQVEDVKHSSILLLSKYHCFLSHYHLGNYMYGLIPNSYGLSTHVLLHLLVSLLIIRVLVQC